MTGNSKILTVSYGSFSCRLEGFDDPLSTLKAIAEYLESRAAPPPCDAQPLTDAAECEIALHVEAHHSDGKAHVQTVPANPREATQDDCLAGELTRVLAGAATPQGQVALEVGETAPDVSSESAAIKAGDLDSAKPDEDAVRIFDEADTHLSATESHERRDIIQHLRAAVAATHAEGSVGLVSEMDDEPYRQDLQSAVRPRRPAFVSASLTPRPPNTEPDPRSAPLKLVDEQRIDIPAQPVRPRRITPANPGTRPAASRNNSNADIL